METKGGYKITNFRVLKKKLVSSIDFEPFIFEGDVEGIPTTLTSIDKSSYKIQWDKYGRCGNRSREDCFVDIEKILEEKLKDIQQK